MCRLWTQMLMIQQLGFLNCNRWTALTLRMNDMGVGNMWESILCVCVHDIKHPHRPEGASDPLELEL